MRTSGRHKPPSTAPSRLPHAAAEWRRLRDSLRPTPEERRALALVGALLLLGAAVRWLRLSGWL